MANSGEIEAAAEATLPDLLKNTPSNIARLEDVIEQSKGRHKYLAATKSPSDGEDVRWYFCKVPLLDKQLAASVPRTEIVGRSDYFRFSMRDSLALEASFLQREEDLLAQWWKEYAECSTGPKGNRRTDGMIPDEELHVLEDERVGVPVKGGLYEVDLLRRHCFPVYWNGENRRVLRGHWFARKGGLDWLPLREDVAEQLELAYRCRVWRRRTFQPSGQFAARVELQGTTQGLHALFTGEDDTWEAWLCLDSSGFPLNVGGGSMAKLRRGFSLSGSANPTQDELRQQKEEEMDDYCSQVPVGHLVFMVHGIGQRLEKANLVDDVGDFRRITSSLADRFLTPFQRSTQRVLFIPCQWRKGLKLSSESAVEKITLDGVRGLRVTLSATVHDVLYYMSPIYCQDIVNSVSNQLNRLHAKFLKRNPGYDGKVSLYGHSLGSVLSYDILCHQHCSSAPFPMDSVNMVAMQEEEPKSMASYQSVKSDLKKSFENDKMISTAVLEPIACKTMEGISTPNSHSVVNEEEKESSSCAVDHFPNTDPQVEYPFRSQIAASVAESDNITSKISNHCPEANDTNEILDIVEHCEVQSTKDAGLSDATVDKDELICLLEEEVSSLRAKIAELEQRYLASNYGIGNSNDVSYEIHYAKGVPGKTAETVLNQYSESISAEDNDRRESYTPYIKYKKLNFKVDTFFAVGSPLGVFLALRNIRIGIGNGQTYWQDEKISEEMPACRQMFNIFHPFDPVAYRIEPLICKDYINKQPVIIPYHRGGKRLHIGFQEFTEDIALRSKAIGNHLNSLMVKTISLIKLKNKDSEEVVEDFQEKERSYGSIMIERLTGSEDGRVDHVLQDKTFQHPYLSALGAHTNYWRDKDTALFILKHLYRDIPEEPPEGEHNTGSIFGRHRPPTKFFFDKDLMDEDTPLTFSDITLIREFSRKAKKAMSVP